MAFVTHTHTRTAARGALSETLFDFRGCSCSVAVARTPATHDPPLLARREDALETETTVGRASNTARVRVSRLLWEQVIA